MLVSHRHRFIYLKTFKTAGTSVEIFLEPYCHGPEPWPGPSHGRRAKVTRDGIIGFRGTEPSGEDATWFNHMPAALLRERLGADHWEAYRKFCVVRNPYDRAVSAFWHLNRAAIAEGAEFAAVRAAFADWLAAPQPILDNTPFYLMDGRFALDEVLRHERLEEDLAGLAARLRLPPAPVALGRYKAAARRRPEPWQAYFDAASARRVEAIAAVEFDLFGYERLRP